MAIFHHQNGDEPNVDYVEILAPEGRNVLRFLCQSPGDGLGDVSTSCTLDRDAVLHLHSVLGEWLYPTHTPEAKNRSLIEQMIEKAVREQVAAILPLHMTPGASFRISGPCAGHVDGERDHDPEPGDVGHPRPAEPEPVAKTCPHGIGWGMRCVKCQGAGEPQHGRLMAELPRRIRNRMWRPEDSRQPAPKCPECLHGWVEHTSSMCWGVGGQDYEGDGCRCTRERP